MGISFTILVALLFVLPGATFVFALHRDVRQVRQRPWDGPYSEALATAIVAAIVLHAIWYWLWMGVCRQLSLPMPDATAFLSLVSGVGKSEAAVGAMQSVATYPIRTTAYFCAIIGMGSTLGSAVRFGRMRFRPRAEGAPWGSMLSPRGATLVNVTLDVELDGTAFLFTGLLRDYSLDQEGALERVVLESATYRPIREAPGGRPSVASAVDQTMWSPIQGHFVVVRVATTKTIDVDYFSPGDFRVVDATTGTLGA